MTVEEALILLSLWIAGTIIGLIVTGLLADRLVIRKIMQNEEIRDLINLFREGKQYLHEILENQKKQKQAP